MVGLWSILSWAPLIRMLYGDLSGAAMVIEVAFAAFGIAVVVPLFVLAYFMLSAEARRTAAPFSVKRLDRFAVYAAVWVTLYGLYVSAS